MPAPSVPHRRLSPRARQLVLQLAAEARAEWGFATDILARAFREERQLPSGDRRMVAETLYGLLRWERRLGAIVDELLAGRRSHSRPVSEIAKQELKLLVHELRCGVPAGALGAEARRLAGRDVDLAAAAGDEAGLAGHRGVDREALRLSHPTWLFQRLAGSLGEAQASLLAGAMNTRAPMCVRANTAKTTREALVRRLAEEGVVARPTRLSPVGLVFETRVNAFGLPAFRDGLFEVMDEGSQLVAEAVAPPPRGRVADVCAGAGGKTLALAAILGNQGRVLALDSNGKKLEELRRRARRAGLSNVLAREVQGTELPDEARLGAWDRVLVDAPCSGLGTLRRNPEARWRLTPKIVDAYPADQLALLVTYAPLVAEGGRLLYATCSVLREENDEVVARFLQERPGFVVMPLRGIWGKERAAALGDGTFLRLLPHVHDTDGFFAAVLRRVG
ncbi:MAG: RsmB/NOP family class I SAM-dependent RNA methyltransferase [Deltaproteobacteria bacterium]|nr:RsmB/NOP family class I SAM-dependent RNA methyltransferase [Deltaproteobacteria bacterium]